MRALILMTSAITTFSLFANELPHAVLRYPGPVDTTERMTSTAYSPDGLTIVAAAESGRVQTWDTRTLSPKLKCDFEDAVPLALRREGPRKSNPPWIRDVRFSPDGKRVVMAGPQGNVWLWTLSDGDCHAQNLTYLNGHTDDVRTVEFSRDGSRLVTTSDDATIRIWDAQGALIKTIDVSSAAGPVTYSTGAAFSPDGHIIVVTRSDGFLAKIDVETFLLSPLREATPGDRAIWQVAFAPNGQTFATASQTGEVALWSTAGVKQKVIRPAGGPGANSVAFTADGLRLAVGLKTQAIVFRLSDGERERAYVGGAGSISRVAFNPDGSKLAVSAFDGTLRLWNLPTRHAY